MKTMFRTLLMALLVLAPTAVSAQKSSDPEGYVTYSLPSTTLILNVEAEQECFYAGPYAKFAEKYLGIKVRQKDETRWQITKVGLTSAVEADLARRYTLALKKNAPDLSFLKLSSAGLVAFADGGVSDVQAWSFPVQSSADFAAKGVSSNLKSEATTLYRSERKEDAYNKVSVQQNMLVEKSLEQKAAEAAQKIVKLREQRLQIVIGDTDATYSGEAMGAAVAELTRLEQEYMSLFIGYSVYQTKNVSFEIIPDAERESQMYVAFRISDTAGPVPSDNLSGRPVVMEIIPQAVASVDAAPVATKLQTVNYLIPAICTVKVKEGSELLIQSRVPVYQLGVMSSMPVNSTL